MRANVVKKAATIVRWRRPSGVVRRFILQAGPAQLWAQSEGTHVLFAEQSCSGQSHPMVGCILQVEHLVYEHGKVRMRLVTTQAEPSMWNFNILRGYISVDCLHKLMPLDEDFPTRKSSSFDKITNSAELRRMDPSASLLLAIRDKDYLFNTLIRKLSKLETRWRSW